MDTETRRQLERYRDEAARKHAQSQRVFEMIIAIATALLEDDASPRPVSHRKLHPHLKLVRGLLIGGAAALAGRLLSDHKAAAVASLTATALAAPLVAVPLILSTPAPNAAPRPVPHARRRDQAPPPSAARPAARRPVRSPAALPVRPGRKTPALPDPAPSASPSSLPSLLPQPLPSLLTPPFPPRQCILRLHGLCLLLQTGAHLRL